MEFKKNSDNQYILFQIIKALNIKSVLDAGMSIINNRSFSRQFWDIEIDKNITLDCLIYIDKEEILPIYKTVFNNIYGLDDDISTHYSLINLSGIFNFMDHENIFNFFITCLELGNIILYDLPLNNENFKDELGVFYSKSSGVTNNHRIVYSMDVIKEIILENIETNNFSYARQLLEKYKIIYKNSEVLSFMENCISKELD